VSLTSEFKPSRSLSAIARTVSFNVLFISSILVYSLPRESKRDKRDYTSSQRFDCLWNKSSAGGFVERFALQPATVAPVDVDTLSDVSRAGVLHVSLGCMVGYYL
jgi:hypothetical protein